MKLGEEAQVGAFFGAGSLALLSLLTLVYLQLRRGATGPAVARGEATCSAWPSAMRPATPGAAPWRSG